MNIKQAMQQANRELADNSSSALFDAQVLLSHTLQCNSAHLIAWPEKELNEVQAADFQKLIEQRRQGLPVAHLTGQREFWSLNFFVNNSTLIPRPETETLVEFILETFGNKKNLKLLDMGTGTGAIAIAIASEKPEWKIFASDVSSDAISLARKNSEHLKTDNTTFIESDWFKNINTVDFNIIISNPPYIANDDPHLKQGDVRFEPDSALTAGKSGMDDIEILCAQANSHLTKEGWLIVEHGYNQKQIVADCFTKNNFTNISQRLDLSGNTRMTAGKVPAHTN